MINNLRTFQEVLKRNNLPTPDTYLGISELIRSLYRPDVSPNPERIREVLEELTWPVTVPAGNPITFKSCFEVLASEALVTFSPKQSGTGDPSPSNIRPISGWDSLVLNQCGKNLFNKNAKSTANGYVDNAYLYNDGVEQSNNSYYISEYIEVFPSIDYVISGLRGDRVFACWYDVDKTYIGQQRYSNSESRTFTLPSNAKYMRISVYKDNEDIVQLEIGSTATAYEPYQCETHTATFPDTVYGGSYDFVSGKGVSEWGYIAEYDGETITEPWLSSIDVYSPGTTPSTGAEVVYKLATPTEITLTPADVNLLKGLNTVWTDGDVVQIKFQILK